MGKPHFVEDDLLYDWAQSLQYLTVSILQLLSRV